MDVRNSALSFVPFYILEQQVDGLFAVHIGNVFAQYPHALECLAVGSRSSRRVEDATISIAG